MAISRSQTGKTVALKPPKPQPPRVTLASSPMEKRKKKYKPFLPAGKKNFVKYKGNTVKQKKGLTASQVWKLSPDVKQG